MLPGGPSARAGLRNGELITRINGRATLRMTELEAEKLFDGKPGTPVRFAVRGDDREREVTLTCEDPRLRTATMRITFTPRSPSGFTQKAETRVADEWQEVAGWIYTADR